MADYLKLARPYFLMLAIVAVGRWILSLQGVPYAKGTDKLSIVILTLFSSIFYGVFCRRWRGFKIMQAVTVGAILGLGGQIVVFLSTLASYLLGLETYFNNPIALNSPEALPMASALGARLGGLVVNTILNGIAGALGWAMGALLPESR